MQNKMNLNKNIILLMAIIWASCNLNNSKPERLVFKKLDLLSQYRYLDSIAIQSLKKIGYVRSEGSTGNTLDQMYSKLSNGDTLDYIFIHTSIINRLAERGKHKEALEYLRLISHIIKKSDRASYYYNVSFNLDGLEAVRKKDSSLFYINKAIEQDSLIGYFFYFRSTLYDANSNLTYALRDIDKAIKLSPTDTLFLNKKGIYEVASGKFQSALKNLQYIPFDQKNNPTIYLYRSICYFSINEYNKALQEINVYFTFGGDEANGYLIRGASKNITKNDTSGMLDIRYAAKLGNLEAKNYLEKYYGHK